MDSTACQRIFADLLHLPQHPLNWSQDQALSVLIEDDHGKPQCKRDEQGSDNVEDGVELGVPVGVEDSCAGKALSIVLRVSFHEVSP